MNSFFSRFQLSKWVVGSSFALFAISVVIVPPSLSQNYFDSLTFPHFALLTISAFVMSIFLLLFNGFRNIGSIESLSFIILIFFYGISIGLSGNPVSSLTGDTQRFTGALSMFAFLVIVIYHSNITIEKTRSLIIGICSIVTLVTILGAFQQWKLITLPGAGGAGSTLGNIDFLSAWIGTTIPLFLFLLSKNNLRKSALVIVELILSIYLLIALDVKQGWVDLILASIFGVIYLLRHRIKALNPSKKNIYWAFGLVGFLWVELVLLVPFQKAKIPLIGTDPNVQIRTQYWMAGLRTFLHSIFFGVGPDNYGNYYQQFRTVTSVIKEETTVSNDAHSAFFQTLSTLGIFGSLAFLLIFSLLVRAIISNYSKYPSQRKLIYFISVFFIIYSTNAMISPITLPNKFIFWALIGVMFGLSFKKINHQTSDVKDSAYSTEIIGEFSFQNFIYKIELFDFKKFLKPILVLISIISIVVTSLAIFSSTKLVLVINDLQRNSKSARVLNYQHSSFLPCTYYYITEQAVANQKSISKVIDFAKAELRSNPRCVDARLTLAKYYFQTNDSAHLGWEVQSLMQMAPANREVLGLVGDIATKLGDKHLLSQLHNQEVKLGYISQ